MLRLSSAVFVLLSFTSPLRSAEVEIRFLAGDRKEPTLVSHLVDFRRSPDGGLIATQWVSGTRVDGKPVFPVISDSTSVPDAPKLAGSRVKSATSDLGDLLNELEKKPVARTVRPVDVVDELYRDAKLSDGRKLGPVRHRTSSARVELSRSSKLSPGSLTPTKSGRVDVLCFPVIVTAVRSGSGERDVFIPRLTLEGRDLLADSLFEHSPDMPLGDESRLAQGSATGQLGWLNATRGGQREFRRLTIYLPLNGDGPAYRLNGREFRMTTAGVVLPDATSDQNPTTLTRTGDFGLQLVLSPEPKPIRLPLLSSLPAGWSVEQTAVEWDVARDRLAPVTVESPGGRLILQPRLPEGDWDGHRFVQVVAADENAEPIVRVIELPTSSDTATGAGRIMLRIIQVGSRGVVDLPARFTAELVANVASVSGRDAFREYGLPPETEAEPVLLSFERTASDRWTAATEGVPAGLFGLKIGAAPQSHNLLPIVIAGSSRGSVSLATWHNRNDYLRGEVIHLGIIARASRDFADVPLSIRLQHDSGEQVDVAVLKVDCPADRTRSQFVTIDTRGLRLGRYVVSAGSRDKPDQGLLTYDTSFTVYDSTPKSNFAVYSWFANSFSGPMKASDKTLVNVLLSQKPSAPLTPEELRRYTSQPAFAVHLRNAFAADPLFPAPETTLRYDTETEREMAVAMRLGTRYCPDYGWGMNGQEAAWNPKHTLPEELKRIQRLCSQVTQRHRDFGNFAGLHLNWYPRLGGNWEQHPATDGNAVPRRELLQQEATAVYAETDADRKSATGGLDRAVRAHKHRVGALARAYDAWTSRARTMTAGTGVAAAAGSHRYGSMPGLDGGPVYTSFPPISWFQQRNYYPSTYHSTLPVAAVHAYTDYGFSPFQPLWGVDHWASGVGDKPIWATTMSNGRDIMLRHALLLTGRGADGIDLKGQDNRTAGVISDFLQSYGPFFRAMESNSDIAIITSLRQQFSTKDLIGQWMGYTGGKYFNLYVKLWYARRPAHMIAEDDVTLERLKKYKAVFILGQQVRMPETAMSALDDYAATDGLVFKDLETADIYPGETFSLAPTPNTEDQRPDWKPDEYVQTRDRHFVGTQAEYESIADSLDRLLSKLPPPRVHSSGHDVMLATLQPHEAIASEPTEPSPRVAAAVFSVNDKRTPPGIVHPWNFWSATIISSRSKLTFDKPYILYDLLEGGREIELTQDGDRFIHDVTFDRCAGRAYIATTRPIRSISVRTIPQTTGGDIPVVVEVRDDQDATFVDPLPMQIDVLNDRGQTVQSIYRALSPASQTSVTIPTHAEAGAWSVRVRELASGITATASIRKLTAESSATQVSPVLVPRPGAVGRFVNRGKAGETDLPVLIALDHRQIKLHGDPIQVLADELAAHIRQSGRNTEVRVIEPDSVVEVTQRWRPNARDQQYLSEAKAGRRIVAVGNVLTRHFRTATGAAGALDAIHPASGWTEPGAVHRIYQDVIILGSVDRHRLLADLHATVGMRAEPGFPANGSALVQVVHDAFTADHDCLSIQAPDLDGMRAGVNAVAELATSGARRQGNNPAVASEDQSSLTNLVSASLTDRTTLPNPIRDVFGATVHPMGFTADGGLLASAGTQAANYFRFDPDGKLDRKWLGKYAVEPDSLNAADTDGMWIREWWGAPGFVDSIVRADSNAQPMWMMKSPKYSRSYAGWRHPGRRFLVDRASGDMFVSGHNRLTRLTPDGEVLWRYDDLETAQDIDSFRFSRDIMLHGLSDDGRFLLAASFGIEPYANLVNRFVRPVVMLVDAKTGALVWEKKELLIDHSACAFASADRIVVADATPGRKRVMLLDLEGNELWSQARSAGTSQAELTPERSWLIVRPEAPRGTNYQTLGPPKGLQAISLDAKQTASPSREFPLTADIHAWRMVKSDGRILVSTVDGWLRCFRPDTSLVWEQRFNGPVNILTSFSGHQIAIGTQNGLLMRLDEDGNVIQKVDLMPHNMVVDQARYVRDYSASPAGTRIVDAVATRPPRVHERHSKVVRFSPNLLPPGDKTEPVASARKWTVTSAKAGNYVLSLLQRTAEGQQSDADERVTVEVRQANNPDPIYSAPVRLSATWQERTLGWKVASPGALEITLKYEGDGTGVELSESGLFTVSYPSRNLLAQRLPDTPGEPTRKPAGDDLDSLLDGDTKKLTPPSVRFFMPNDVDLTARSRGAAPFRSSIPYTVPFDGNLAGQKTSWLGKPVTGSTHAQMQLKFESPVELSAFTVYEDTAAGYTDTYAIFCRDAKTKQWHKAGHVKDNASPFNLFTFPTIETDAVTWLWLKSADRHARIAEMEGFRVRKTGR